MKMLETYIAAKNHVFRYGTVKYVTVKEKIFNNVMFSIRELEEGSLIHPESVSSGGLQGIIEVEGILYPVNIPLKYLHKLDFGTLDTRNTTQDE